MINHIKPYIIIKTYDIDEFINLQIKLFGEGYTWIDGQVLFTPPGMFQYPLCISNLQFKSKQIKSKFDNIRDQYNSYGNDILFFGYEHDFDINKLRLLKIDEINKIS